MPLDELATVCRMLEVEHGKRRSSPNVDPSLTTCFDNTHGAGWSSPVAREAHNLEVAGSNPVPAIIWGCEKSQPLASLCKTGVSFFCGCVVAALGPTLTCTRCTALQRFFIPPHCRIKMRVCVHRSSVIKIFSQGYFRIQSVSSRVMNCGLSLIPVAAAFTPSRRITRCGGPSWRLPSGTSASRQTLRL